MITNELIKQIFVDHGFSLNNATCDDLKPYVYKAARALIAEALRVKTLEWHKDSLGYPTMYAKTEFGTYSIPYFENGEYAVCFCNLQMEGFDSQDAAKACAQRDFEQRTLANLVHGND